MVESSRNQLPLTKEGNPLLWSQVRLQDPPHLSHDSHQLTWSDVPGTRDPWGHLNHELTVHLRTSKAPQYTDLRGFSLLEPRPLCVCVYPPSRVRYRSRRPSSVRTSGGRGL